MSIQAGSHCLEKEVGGSGILLGGVPVVEAARVLVIGGGVVGTNAISMALGLEASVTVIGRSLTRLKELDSQFCCKFNTVYSTRDALWHHVTKADLYSGVQQLLFFYMLKSLVQTFGQHFCQFVHLRFGDNKGRAERKGTTGHGPADEPVF